MKNMFKKLGLILASALILASMFGGMAFAEGDKGYSIEEIYRNGYSVSIHEKMIDHFPVVIVMTEYGPKEVIQYPDEYAGAYIDNNHNLNILLVKGMDHSYDYRALTGYDESVRFLDADFSYNQLCNVQSSFESVMLKYDIESVGLNEIDNALDVCLRSDLVKQEILNYLGNNIDNFSSNIIIFKESRGLHFTASNTSSNALAGSVASYTSGGYIYSATLGFNAYNSSGQYGVVTAAHFATSGTSIKNASGTTIGSASVRQYSGTIDAAFIPFPSGISPSYKFCYPNPCDNFDVIHDSCTPLLGMLTCKIGGNTGLTWGTVLATSVNVSVKDEVTGIITTFTDQIRISNTQLKGDSGGPVFNSYIVYEYGGFVATCQRIMGIATFADGSNYGYVSKIGNICSILSVSLYYSPTLLG